MRQATQMLRVIPREDPEYGYTTPTLYDLIEAINEELKPGEEEFLGRIVLDLAEDQRIQSVRNAPEKRTDVV